MPSVNLLPWRETLRKDREKRFYALLGVVGILAAGIVLLGNFYVGVQQDNQKNRNAILEQEIQSLEAKIKEIKKLKAQKDMLLARMGVIGQLQAKRPEIVHLFDELVRKIPEGVTLTSLVQKDNSLVITGYAQSNARVSSLMEELESSDWFAGADLNIIKSGIQNKSHVSDFTLNIKQVSPQTEEGDDA